MGSKGSSRLPTPPSFDRIQGIPSPLALPRKLGLADFVTAQDDVEHALHVAKKLLVGRSGTALKIGDNSRGCVALRSEVLLRHSGALVVLGFRSRLRNRLPDLDAHRLGLDNVVGAVDLCETLAFGVSGLGMSE